MSMSDFKAELMHPRLVILHQVVCVLIASKLNECDDNITVMNHLIQYI